MKPKSNLCYGCGGSGHYAAECPTTQKEHQRSAEPNQQQNNTPRREWTPRQATPACGYTPQPNRGATPGPNTNQRQSMPQVTYQDCPIKLEVNAGEGAKKRTPKTKKTSRLRRDQLLCVRSFELVTALRCTQCESLFEDA
jgi:hypothetical protein